MIPPDRLRTFPTHLQNYKKRVPPMCRHTETFVRRHLDEPADHRLPKAWSGGTLRIFIKANDAEIDGKHLLLNLSLEHRYVECHLGTWLLDVTQVNVYHGKGEGTCVKLAIERSKTSSAICINAPPRRAPSCCPALMGWCFDSTASSLS